MYDLCMCTFPSSDDINKIRIMYKLSNVLNSCVDKTVSIWNEYKHFLLVVL